MFAGSGTRELGLEDGDTLRTSLGWMGHPLTSNFEPPWQRQRVLPAQRQQTWIFKPFSVLEIRALK